MRSVRIFIFLCFIMFVPHSRAEAVSISAINVDVHEFKLKNGMQFLIVERHIAPQVACRVAIRAGSALEEAGKTGIAHMVEHMMFKGTKNFGTLDPERDQKLQRRIEAAYRVVLREEGKRKPNQELIRAKLEEMSRLRLEVQKIYVPQAFSSQLAKNGAVNINAFTTKDQTQYFMSIPSDMIEQWFSIVSEQLFEPAWREFYVEKEVVQREWAFRYLNNPDGAAWLDLYATMFNAHPYHNPTIGWKSHMEKFSATDAIQFHRKYYNPTNAVCVLVGDVTVEKARALAQIYFGRYPPGERAPEHVSSDLPQQGPRKSIRFLKGARTPRVLIGFHAARMGTEDFYALDVLSMILSHGRGALLNQQIVNKGLAVEAWAANPDNRYGGIFILGGSPKEPSGLKSKQVEEKRRRGAYIEFCREFEELVLGEAEKLKKELVSERELKRVQKLAYRDLLDSIQTNEMLARTLATFEVQVGWRYLLSYLKKISEVTPYDIRRVANRFLCAENKTSIYVIPGGKLLRPPEPYREIRSLSGSAAARTSLKPTTFVNHSIYPTPKGWKHPLSFNRRPTKIKYRKAEEAHVRGATIFFLPDRELPLVQLTLLVKAGSVDICDAKYGLAKVFNESLVPGGTQRHSPSELARILDENAIRIRVSVREEDTAVKLSVLEDDWSKGLELLKEILTEPRFDAKVLEAAKKRIMTSIKRQGGNAHVVSAREAMIWHFKGHPYGRDPLLALKTIPGITAQDLESFLKRFFVPSNMVFCISGDIEKERVVNGVEKLLQAFPGTNAPERRLRKPSPTPPVLAFIHKDGQVQSHVTMVLGTMERTQPGYWKMSLLADLFGGADSLTYTRLREDLGLAYAAWFYQTYRWKAGLLLGYIGCKAGLSALAIKETVNIMKSLRKKIPSAELERKRLDVLNSFVFNVDTPDELVETYGRYYLRKEPLDTLERIQEAYMSAKASELLNLARDFLDPAKLQIFVVGDKNSSVETESSTTTTLEDSLVALSRSLGLPFKEIPLR
ncbi:MAG: insulinase family protein [Deltaproteobacteria bacterium]|nr:insulinase family protein [Deltaproteobacteria bacterium]MBW1934305.1 insulinase family protein [Deltaproteobacteria bacterium]MBW1977274.1 insulinase family protein [Deltaproteobacteria bacterium]MBW2043834.1 insulinase family protein [Deltaproteobacteria bacterium]MBW2300958.1 insulinase family protein [Deltaproteobacteria bacterium]